MNPHTEQFSKMSSEYLLQRRALGDHLSDEAHAAIEAAFRERGEFLPPRPNSPIYLADPPLPSTRTRNTLRKIVWIFLMLVSAGFAKQIAPTWIGVLITAGLVVVALTVWLRKPNTNENRTAEDVAKQAARDGLDELMLSAANGNMERLRELVAYGRDVNVRSPTGATALMYAARNNHAECIRFLLSVGADPMLASDKGATALAIAEKFGHAESAAVFKEPALD